MKKAKTQPYRAERQAIDKIIAGKQALRDLDDDRATAAARATFVVGDMAFGQTAFVIAEVGDVRAEQRAVGGRPGSERNRFEQFHESITSRRGRTPHAGQYG